MIVHCHYILNSSTMTNIEVKFYERVPYELHELNENLEQLINLLLLKNNGAET